MNDPIRVREVTDAELAAASPEYAEHLKHQQNRERVKGALAQIDEGLRILDEVGLPDVVRHEPFMISAKLRKSGTWALLLHSFFALKARYEMWEGTGR